MSEYIKIDDLDDTVLRLNNDGWGITRNEHKLISNVLYEMPLYSFPEEKGEEYRRGWHDAIGKALNEAYDIDVDGERFSVVQEETLLGLGMSVEPFPDREKGEWILVVDREDEIIKENHWECSKCGSSKSGWGEYKFCPDCGADMRGKDNDSI